MNQDEKNSAPEKTPGIHRIQDGEILVALVLYVQYNEPGVSFITPPQYSQQLAFQRRPAGEKICAHFHNPVPRSVEYSLEVLMVRKGALRVDLYGATMNYLGSVVLRDGDTIFLASGGHGLEVLEEVELVEVKQGPYPGIIDKSLFSDISPGTIRLLDRQ